MWMRRKPCTRFGPRAPGAPIRLPEQAFEEIEPVVDEQGRTLRRFRLKAWPNGPIATELPPAEPIHVGEIIHKPLELPVGGIFFLDYKSPFEDK